jgi:hypothetical protein
MKLNAQGCYALLLFSSVIFAPEVRAEQSPTPVVERFALVIANNRPPRADVEALRYADDDAVATHRLLLEAGVDSRLLVSLDSDSSALVAPLVPDGPASASDVERAFVDLSMKMQAAIAAGHEVEFLFFFSGHGDVEHGEGFVAFEGSKFTRTQLFELLRRSPATRNHVFIDACKSYFMAFSRGPGGTRQAIGALELAAEVPAELSNTGFVLSTASDRESHEWERYSAGIVSHEVRSALRGAADADLDGNITYAELGAFLGIANRGIANPRYRPDFLVHPPNDELGRSVLSWRVERAALHFSPGPWGHIYVENAQGERLLDAHPDPAQALSLWLPEQRPLFVRRDDGKAEYTVRTNEPLSVPPLNPKRAELASRGALSLALERLFQAPFSSRDVELYRAPNQSLGAEPMLMTTAAPKDASPSHANARTLRWLSGVVALAGVGGGLTMNTAAYIDYQRGRHASQLRTRELNDRVSAFNTVSVGFYGLAIIAGALWFSTDSEDGQFRLLPLTADAASGPSFGLDLTRQF